MCFILGIITTKNTSLLFLYICVQTEVLFLLISGQDSFSSSDKPHLCHFLLPCYLSWPEQFLPILQALIKSTKCLLNYMNFRSSTVWHFSSTKIRDAQPFTIYSPGLFPHSKVTSQSTGPAHNISHSTHSSAALNILHGLVLACSYYILSVNIQHLPEPCC